MASSCRHPLTDFELCSLYTQRDIISDQKLLSTVNTGITDCDFIVPDLHCATSLLLLSVQELSDPDILLLFVGSKAIEINIIVFS